jgi:hypothetical protein
LAHWRIHGEFEGGDLVKGGDALWRIGAFMGSLRAVTWWKVAMRCAHWRIDGEFEGGDLVEGGDALRALAHSWGV